LLPARVERCYKCGKELAAVAQSVGPDPVGPGLGPPSFDPSAPPTTPSPTFPTMPTSKVDAFDDSLVPFLGDPDGSRAAGKLVQGAAAIMVVYNLVRAVLWLRFSGMASSASSLRGGVQSDDLISLGRTIDTFTLLFWPGIIGLLICEFIWQRKRRPPAVLKERGEAYVEATLRRVNPMWIRITTIGLIVVALMVSFSSPTVSRVRTVSELSNYATTRAAYSGLWAVVFALVIVTVWFSEQHLAKRVAKATDPALAMYSVPYVEPEKDNRDIGESAGIGWLLTTLVLVMLGLFSLIGIIGGISALPTKDAAAGAITLLISSAVFGLVVWAFVRRWNRRKQS
jgi:hypothetical protein